VGGWPDYIGVCDASSHGVGGIIFGENELCIPTVFRWEWPQEIKDLYHDGIITSSDLEMAGLLLLWLVMESVCGSLKEKRVALFSDNSPMVGWVRRLATWGSMVSAHLIRALALCLKLNRTCPITPLHIAGEENSMSNIPSRSFGSEPKWHCKSNTKLLSGRYASDFHVADEGSHTGRVVATSKGRETCWSRWLTYVAPMGVEPFLQDTPFTIRVRLLTGFAGRVRTGYYGQGKQIQA